MGSAEPRGCLEGPEPAHRVGALLDAPMILFQPAIQVAIPAVDDLPAERPADGAGGGIGKRQDSELDTIVRVSSW
jgi:hypothetical protein